MALKLPIHFLTLLDSLTFFELDLPVDCYVTYTFYEKLISRWLLPIVLMFMLLSIFVTVWLSSVIRLRASAQARKAPLPDKAAHLSLFPQARKAPLPDTAAHLSLFPQAREAPLSDQAQPTPPFFCRESS